MSKKLSLKSQKSPLDKSQYHGAVAGGLACASPTHPLPRPGTDLDPRGSTDGDPGQSHTFEAKHVEAA
jgi:hypothetical protein